MDGEQRDFGRVLSTELWIMIFELLPSRKNLRLVSSRFNTIATPIGFRAFPLSSSLVASRPTQVVSRIAIIVKAHTRFIHVTENCRTLNWYRGVKFLAECRAFRQLIWGGPEGLASLPVSVQNASRHEWSQVQLNYWIPSPVANLLFEADGIPQANLASLIIESHLSFSQEGREKMNALIVASKQLKALNLPKDFHLKVAFGKIAPIEKLITQSWPYNAREVEEIWDFSKLQTFWLGHLSETLCFLNSVTPKMFPVLKVLRVMENLFYSKADQKSSSTKLSAFISNLGQLEDLEVTAFDPVEVMKSLPKHQTSLRYFALSEMRPSISHIGMEEVKSIVGLCPNIFELRLTVLVPGVPEEQYGGMSPQVKCIMDSINVLATLRNLRRIDLRCIVSKANYICHDELGYQLANHFNTQKKGVHAERFKLTVEAPLSEDRFEYKDCYEWPMQLLPPLDLQSDEDRSQRGTPP